MEKGKSYDVIHYWRAREEVKNARKRVNDLPEEMREECLSIIAQAVKGTFDACREIYDSDQPVIHPGSITDRETDRLGLRDLSRFFN